MLKIIPVTFFIFLCSAAFSQVQRKAGQFHLGGDSTLSEITIGLKEKKIDRIRLTKQLNLTKEQTEKIKILRDANKMKRDEIMNDGSFTQDERIIKVKEIRRSFLTDLRALLTEEQKQKLKKLRANKGSVPVS